MSFVAVVALFVVLSGMRGTGRGVAMQRSELSDGGTGELGMDVRPWSPSRMRGDMMNDASEFFFVDCVGSRKHHKFA